LDLANALLAALEDWAKSLGEAGITRSDGAGYFPSRQVDRTMRRAHREGRLFEALTEWLPSYCGLRTSIGVDAYANRMRDIVEHGCPLWESIVAELGRPWSAHITPKQRRILHRSWPTCTARSPAGRACARGSARPRKQGKSPGVSPLRSGAATDRRTQG